MPLLGSISMGALRMSKYISKAARKRLPLTTKHARKGFYKGNKCASTGTINSKGEYLMMWYQMIARKYYVYYATNYCPFHVCCKGKFVVDEDKQIVLNVPDLKDFKVSFKLIISKATAYYYYPVARPSKQIIDTSHTPLQLCLMLIPHSSVLMSPPRFTNTQN